MGVDAGQGGGAGGNEGGIAAGFGTFHVYVCAAFLGHFAADVKKLQAEEIIMFLQALPTQAWSDKEIEELISKAYVNMYQYESAQNHFR